MLVYQDMTRVWLCAGLLALTSLLAGDAVKVVQNVKGKPKKGLFWVGYSQRPQLLLETEKMNELLYSKI